MRSKFEETFAADLTKRGIAFTYEPESFVYTVERKYTPDFKVKGKTTLPRAIFLETKGYFTPADRAKTLRVLSMHPELDLRFVFQNASNKLGKGSRTTYGEWCTKHGIPWADKRAPAEWFK